MKNLAGHDVHIFLYKFVLLPNGISFVLNESIAEDMYHDIDKAMQPYIHACGETLFRYRAFCPGETIMDGNILTDGCFEVMLSKGLGVRIVDHEKQALFDDANEIAFLLMDVMDKRTKEEQQGTYPGPQKVVNKIQPIRATSEGLEALGEKRQILDELLHGAASRNPGVKRLRPEDLPDGIVAQRGYDHRGHCVAFEHNEFGELGKIVLIPIAANKMQMQADLTKGDPNSLKVRKALFEDVIAIVSAGMERIGELQEHG